MQAFRALLSRAYRSFRGRILLSLLLTAAALAAFACVQRIAYLTNDDNAIAFTLAGYHTGTPWPYALFTNCLVGYAVSGLYTAFPTVAWWAALQLAAIGVSSVAIGAALLKMGEKRDAPLLVPLGLQAALLLLLVLAPFVEPTYTVTAAILGAAGAALLYVSADETARGKRILPDALGLLFTVLAFLIREETGFAALCFFFAACVYRVLHAVASGDVCMRKRAYVSAISLAVSVAVLCGGALLYNNAMHARVNGEEYETFFRYRERFTDYPRPSYADAPELYASVGWDETVYALANDWCFMDERIDSGALQRITEAETQKVPLLDAAKACVETVDADVPSRLTALALLLAFVCGLYLTIRNFRCWPALAMQAALLLGVCALCLYLGVQGRFLLRTFRVIAIPAMVSLCMLLLGMLPPKADRPGRRGMALFTAMLLLVSCVSALLCAKELRGNSPKQLIADSRAVYAYVLEHPENVYIRDTFVLNNADAWTVYPDEKPVNLLSWGGCEARSAESERQFLLNGLSSRYADVFSEDNVYCITRTDSTEHAVLTEYLMKWKNATGMTMVEGITDGIAVYRVTY